MNKFSNALIFALAILGGLFIVLVIFFAITDADEPETSFRDDTELPTATIQPLQSDYIGYAFEEAFMNGCLSEGASNASCQCMFDYLDTNLTNQELKNLSNLADPSEDPVFDKAVNSCV